MAWRGPTVKPILNRPPNKVSSGPEMSDKKQEVSSISGPPIFGPEANRGREHNIRRDTDDRKDFAIKLIDIDAAILGHMDNVISPTIVDSGRQIKVPINYASPERWKAIRKDGSLRDKNGKVQTPAIAFRRSTVQRNDNLITLNRYLQYPVMRKFSEKNKYDKFSVMNGFAPRKEIYSVAMPDHVIINYEFIIWTELVEQCNSVIEAINFATEDYWGDKNRFKFRTSISDYNFETTNDAGQDRIVKATFGLICNAYLLPEKFENYKTTTQKAFTPRKVVFDVHEKIVNGTAERAVGASVSIKDGNTIPAVISPTITYNIINQNSTLEVLNIVGGGDNGGATGSFTANSVTISGSADIDSQLIGDGNAARWLVSISNGSDIKVNEVMSSWNNVSSSFYVTEVSQIGYVPVSLSVNNVGGSIHLLATPLSGTWTLKYIKMVV